MSTRPMKDFDHASDMLELGLGEPSDLPRTLRRIVQTAQKLFSADICAISVINPITGRFVSPPTTTADQSTDGAAALDQPQVQAVMEYVLDQRVVFVEDVSEHPEYQRLFSQLAEIRSFAGLALQADDDQRAIAVLCLLFRTPQQFGADQRELLFVSTDAAIPILRHTWLMHRYRAVARIGQEINQELETVELLFQKLQSRVANILDTSHFFLLAVYQPQSNSLDLYMSLKGTYESRLDFPLTGACKHVIEQQVELVFNRFSSSGAETPPPVIPLPGTNLQEESLIFIPLSLRDVPYGVLSVQHLKPDVYDAEDVHILQLLGNYVALALSNIRLYDHVLRLNEAGQFLTQQLESEQVLQGVVDQIRETTKADIVTLYPYDQVSGEFERPPRMSGQLLEPGFRSLNYSRPDDIAALTLKRPTPLFIDSGLLYEALGGEPQDRQGSFALREQLSSTAAMPLRVVNEPIGVLFVNFRRPQRFDAPQRQLIWGLANYAAIAIKNAREFGAATRRRIEELQLLRRIDREISKTLDLEQVMQAILDMATEHIQADAASIILYDPRWKILKMEAATGRHAQSKQPFTLRPDENRGITSWVFKHKQPMRVGNVGTNPTWRHIYVAASSDTLSELDVPLLRSEEVVGVINFESMAEDAFSEADEEFLVTLAERAVLAVKNAQDYKSARRTAEERKALINIGQEIIREFDTARIFDLILAQALKVTQSQAGTLRLYDAQRADLWIVAERGVRDEEKDRRIKLGEGIIGRVAQSREPLNIGDVTTSDWAGVFLHSIPGIRSELAVPLLEDKRLHGVLNIESPDPNHFDESDQRLLTALAGLSVIALQTAERYKRAEEGNALQHALYEVDQTIIRQLDSYDQVMETILKYALVLTGGETADLDLYEDDELSVIYSARLDEQGQLLPRGPIPAADALAEGFDQGIISIVASTRASYRSQDDVQDDPHYAGDPAVHSEVAVPLLAGKDKLIGVLNLESTRHYAFDDKAFAVLQSLAGQAVIAIQSARHYANARIERRRFQLLHQAGQELANITDLAQLDQAYEAVIQIAEQHFIKSRMVIRRYDEQTQELVLMLAERYRDPLPFARIRLDENLSELLVKKGREIIVPDITAPQALQIGVSDPKTRSLAITPIMFKDHYYGTLGLSHEKVGYFQSADIELIKGLAQQVAITIHRLEAAHAQQEAEQHAAAAEIMASIGQANFELAHRLGNDLGLVRTYVNNIRLELKERGIANEAIDGELDKIVADVRRVLKLSKDLKQELAGFRNAEREENRAVGQPLRDRVVMPVAELLEETRQALPPIPPNINLQWNNFAGAARLEIAPAKIVAIFVNLVMNAIEAMPDGGTITIRARNAGRYVDFEIQDTGVGISPDKQMKIFDMLYTAKVYTTKEDAGKKGSGFGLWSARHNALANGGELSVRSTPGQGATFTLRLPKVE